MDKLFKRIYEDMMSERLSESRFQMLSDDYERDQAKLHTTIDRLNQEISEQESQADNINKLIELARKYLDLEELTPTVLNDLVNAVYVNAPNESSGHREQNITISYNYIGVIPSHMLNELKSEETA